MVPTHIFPLLCCGVTLHMQLARRIYRVSWFRTAGYRAWENKSPRAPLGWGSIHSWSPIVDVHLHWIFTGIEVISFIESFIVLVVFLQEIFIFPKSERERFGQEWLNQLLPQLW